MWFIALTVCGLIVLLLLAKAWLGRSARGATLGHMSDQWLAENRNSHHP